MIDVGDDRNVAAIGANTGGHVFLQCASRCAKRSGAPVPESGSGSGNCHSETPGRGQLRAVRRCLPGSRVPPPPRIPEIQPPPRLPPLLRPALRRSSCSVLDIETCFIASYAYKAYIIEYTHQPDTLTPGVRLRGAQLPAVSRGSEARTGLPRAGGRGLPSRQQPGHQTPSPFHCGDNPAVRQGRPWQADVDEPPSSPRTRYPRTWPPNRAVLIRGTRLCRAASGQPCTRQNSLPSGSPITVNRKSPSSMSLSLLPPRATACSTAAPRFPTTMSR